jgi:uncharacterized DUF497 family protein
MAGPDDPQDLESFDWDAANIEKLWRRHGVTQAECEEVFFDNDKLISYDSEHSYHEERYQALGRTAAGRLLFIVFTLRGGQLRAISARDMTRREQSTYAQQEKTAETPSTIRKRRRRK